MAMREQSDDRAFGADRTQGSAQSPAQNASATRGQGNAAGVPDDARLTSDAATSGRARAGRSNRGFASMDPNKQKEIASKGGRAAHAKGTAHEFNSNEARNAGRKGGVAVSRNRDHMAAIGRKGGEARGAARRAAAGSANATSNATSSPRDLSATGGARGATQNSRAGTGGMLADREVGINGANQNSAGTVGSLGGERNRANVTSRGEENVERA